jgi:DNA transposition AAA+ family ATPase
MKSERFAVVPNESTASPQLTSIQQSIWEGLKLCDSLSFQGVFLGPSGIGKSHCVAQYAKGQEDILVVRLSVVQKRPKHLLAMIAERLRSNYGYWDSPQDVLESIVRHLRQRWKFLIVDEAHLVPSWEAWEALRQIHDEVEIPIAYVGQPRLYETMRSKGLVYDQLLGRLPIRRLFKGTVSLEDCKIVAEALHPGLDRKALNFLHKKAQADGKFRQIKYLLGVAQEVAGREGMPIDYPLLCQVAKGLGL